jgi:hypothetical protein
MSSAVAEPIDEFLEPVEHASLRQQHLAVLGLSIGVIVLSLLMTTIDDRQVAFAGLSHYPLPDVCQSRLWLQMDCPGCGLTRSFIHFFHGRFAESFQMHRFGWLLALLVALQIPYRLAALTLANGLPLGKVFPQALGIGLVVLFTVNWLLKLMGV